MDTGVDEFANMIDDMIHKVMKMKRMKMGNIRRQDSGFAKLTEKSCPFLPKPPYDPRNKSIT